MSLEQLLNRRQDLWRGRATSPVIAAGEPTGFSALDAVLSWGGWPPGSLSEILEARPGVAFTLTQPALARLSSQARWLMLLDPPFLPYAPALAAAGLNLSRLVVVDAGEQGAWAAEQGLRSGACSAVLAWGKWWEVSTLRRLQLAAEAGGCLALLFRHDSAARGPSPAPLRLRVRPTIAGREVVVLKQRGGRAGAVLELPLCGPFASPLQTGIAGPALRVCNSINRGSGR